MQPGHAEVSPWRTAARGPAAEGRRAHQRDAAEALRRLNRRARQELAAEGDCERVHGLVPVAARDHIERVVQRIGHQARGVGARAAIRVTVAWQIRGVDRTRAPEVLEQGGHLVYRGCGVDRMHQQQGRGRVGTGDVQADGAGTSVQSQQLAGDGQWQRCRWPGARV